MPDPPRAQQLGADHPELHPSGPDDALSSALAGSDPDPDPQFGGGGLTTSSSAPGSSGFDRDGHFERHDPEPNAAGGGGGSLGGLGLTGVATEKPPADVVANGDTRTDGSPATPKPNFVQAFGRALWTIVTSSWINVLLIFVPVGIAVAQIESLKGPVAFSMNAVAIVPLAGLLSFATESVAAQMGDAIGALMNVTFGNAVELIIFIIALSKDEIRIVQASLLGSILSNLLLILGMCFLFGGLRYREQIYNSTVTQMSACLLSLSVCSLTAFHASFKNETKADEDTLKVSRGTSVILLLVYGLYLLFQLKSHAYMYESTPQHIVDAESTPGPAAGWLDSSSSSDSSSSDSSDSDSSRDTVRKRMKKVLRRRKDSDASAVGSVSPTAELQPVRTLSAVGSAAGAAHGGDSAEATNGDSDASDDDERWTLRAHRRKHKRKHREKKERKRQRRLEKRRARELQAEGHAPTVEHEPRRVDFAMPAQSDASTHNGIDDPANPRRSFPALRGLSVRTLRPSVFASDTPAPSGPAGPVPRVRYGIRRTNSLPDRLTGNGVSNSQVRPPGGLFPARIPAAALFDDAADPSDPAAASAASHHHLLSRPMAIALLLISTALVAVCAEFMVDSIELVTEAGGVPELFIGLIILPIVGNAAEHVTAITVAMKNKMDLAIGVAIGSSIQIALLVTPFIVILGWIMGHDMTLYFTLFETVCLFVSAFIVNFLVLDGRSNYLEGALLCATYVIIAVVAFFSPQGEDANQFGE